MFKSISLAIFSLALGAVNSQAQEIRHHHNGSVKEIVLERCYVQKELSQEKDPETQKSEYDVYFENEAKEAIATYEASGRGYRGTYYDSFTTRERVALYFLDPQGAVTSKVTETRTLAHLETIATDSVWLDEDRARSEAAKKAVRSLKARYEVRCKS